MTSSCEESYVIIITYHLVKRYTLTLVLPVHTNRDTKQIHIIHLYLSQWHSIQGHFTFVVHLITFLSFIFVFDWLTQLGRFSGIYWISYHMGYELNDLFLPWKHLKSHEIDILCLGHVLVGVFQSNRTYRMSLSI